MEAGEMRRPKTTSEEKAAQQDSTFLDEPQECSVPTATLVFDM